MKTKCAKTEKFSGWETPYEYCMCWQHCYVEDRAAGNTEHLKNKPETIEANTPPDEGRNSLK